MKRILKFVLVLLLVLVVLVVALPFVLPLVLDPNDYRDDIEQVVEARTGRALSIAGPIEWSVFPWVGITLNDVSLANAPGFGEEPLAAMEQLGASVKLLPLLRKNVQVGEVTLAGLALRPSVAASGASNWESILEALEASADAPAEPSGDSGFGPESLVIEAVTLSDSLIVWDDRQADQRVTLSNVELAAADIELGQPFTLDGGFDVKVDEPPLTGAATISSRVDADAELTRFALADFRFELDGRLEGESPTPLELAVSGAAEVDNDAGKGRLSDWQVRLFGLTLRGDFALDGLNDEPVVSGALELDEFSPRDLLAALNVELPPPSDGDVLRRASAKLTLNYRAEDIRFDPLRLQLDDTSLTGSAGLRGAEPARIEFDLAVDDIDLDRYLPAESSGDDAATAETEPLTVDTFRDIHADGVFRVASLQVSGLSASNVEVRVRGDGQGVRLHPLTADFYGGRYTGDITVNASGERPVLSMNESLAGVQALPILSDLQEGDGQLEGIGSFNLQLRTDLSTPDTIMQALNGNLGFDFRDGAIRGINIAQRIRQAKASLQGKTLAATDEVQKTDFSEFQATAEIVNGVLRSDDLKLLSPLLRVLGDGRVNLAEQTLDYTVKPVLVGSLEGQGTEDEQLSGVPIPIRLTGSLSEPQWKIDVAAAIKESQQARIDEKKEELKGRLVDKLLGDDEGETADTGGDKGSGDSRSSGERRRDLLKGLLGGRDEDDEPAKDEPDS